MDKISATSPGTLYVVATPIGNLNDMSLRAIDTLKNVDVILAEDTRHSGQLLHALGIQKQLISLHAHNENEKSEQIITALAKGQSYALISDAGTPLISDPGFSLVRDAQQEGIKIVPIPGACALITAISASGVPCDQFLFFGFLPAKPQARLKALQALSTNEYTTILYESTHRILACLDDIIAAYGPHYQLVVAKELTKTFEQFIYGTGKEIGQWLNEEPGRCKGEFVIILPPLTQVKVDNQDQHLLNVLLSELPLKQAVKLASQLSSTPKNELYKLALHLQSLL